MKPDKNGVVTPGKRGALGRLGITLAPLCLAFGLLSCSSAPVKDSPALLTPQTPLIWPSPPEPAKISYLKAISRPEDIGANRGFVTDSAAGKVFVFSPKGKFIKGFSAGSRPTGIAINRTAGLVYVSDTVAHAVNIYTLEGKPAGSFGKLGTLEGEFNYQVDITIDRDGMVYVVDSMNFRIQIFDKDGRFNSSFGRHGDGTGDFSRPKGVAVDRDGNIYVADALFDTVQIFDRQGTFLLNFGSVGKTAGRFWLPSGLFIDDGNKIFVGDSYNSRVQVFEYLG